MTVTLVLGNDTTYDYRCDDQSEFLMYISQDGRLIMSEMSEQDSDLNFSSPQSTQFILPQKTTQIVQLPYYSQDNKQTATSDLGFQSQKANVSESQRTGMFQGVSVGIAYLPELGNHGLEMMQVRFGAKFGLPAPLKDSFILVSPSFEPTFVKWDGQEPFPDALYSASLGCTLMKKINDHWSAMASVGPRWSSDGREMQSAVRCSLMGGMTWKKASQWQFSFGVIYSNRDDSFNILPFGGLVWTPNEDWKYELMVPMLRVSRKCHYFQKILPYPNEPTHWGYAGIGFGGGTWAFQSVNNMPDVANYTEFSVVLGLESDLRNCS